MFGMMTRVSQVESRVSTDEVKYSSFSLLLRISWSKRYVAAGWLANLMEFIQLYVRGLIARLFYQNALACITSLVGSADGQRL
jgi:hypothetical protein